MGEFKKEVTFLSNVFDTENESYSVVEITKEATFKELHRQDNSQHKLHFMLFAIYKVDDDGQMKVDSDQLYDITVKAINVLLVPDSNFTEQDKIEFLADGIALIRFGSWLLNNKIAPFFGSSILKSKT